ncbi:MAG: rod shape-determining protein RodA [Deltaproteobacteria bacterium]|nr:rod shape-determining protein RodA [Deltaproteobacteria bacterium]
MFDRRLLTHFDWFLFTVAITLSIIGIANIYSATSGEDIVHIKQLYWFSIGLILMLVITFMDYHQLERFAYIVYGLSVTLLVAVLIIGKTTSGAQRWLSVGPVSFQPSELAKISLVVMLARHFSEKRLLEEGLSIKDLMLPASLLLVPFIIVAKEPDLGTALILFFIFASMSLFVKIRLKTLIGLVVTFLPFIPLTWHLLKDYQQVRILSFWDPTMDPRGTGYHLIQSKIAIGSGGLLGKGFGNGTQAQLKFLPEHHTDFVFSVLAEEWGFVGSVITLGLYLILFLWGLKATREAKDRFGTLLAFGISSMFFWHIAINIGMVTGLLPVVGVPLPFISYGGSFLLMAMIGVGILINVRMRRFIF